MMKYTEPSTSSELPTVVQNSDDLEELPDAVEETPISSARDGNISLTRLWEFIVRWKRLPDDLNLDAFFAVIHLRLRNPEWVVRQHALRVLVDFIPLVDKEDLDTKIGSILNELVRNLGHVGPAVRKGAVDALKTYLNNTNRPNTILKALVSKGVQNVQQSKITSNITLGIIIAIPFLINSKIKNDVIKYTINVLLDKVNQALHQESILRSLLRIKGIIGVKKFEEIVENHQSRREFEMLCNLYNLPEPSLNVSAGEMFCATDNKHFWNDHNQNLINSSFENDVSDCEVENKNNLAEDKVILETEIKLDAGPAIMMKIHEESRQNSANETSDSEEETRGIKTFKVLTDSEDDYELVRRTPRRVRFGGEIVKMRTPDSDSNHQSDDDPIISINENEKKPIIELQHKKTTKLPSKSNIPILVAPKSKTIKSEPNSPKKINMSKLYKSSPNLLLKANETFKDGKSRIPRRNEKEKKEISRNATTKMGNVVDKDENSKGNVEVRSEERKIIEKKITEKKITERKITEQKIIEKKTVERKVTERSIKSMEDKTEEAEKLVKEKRPTIEQKKNEEVSKNVLAIEFQPKGRLSTSPVPEKMKSKSAGSRISRRNSREFDYSPIPVHNEIEVFHNLTRSPERKQTVKKDPDPSDDRHLTTADDILLGRKIKSSEVEENRRIQTADVADRPTSKTTNNQLVFINNFNSFHVYNPANNKQAVDFADSPIPTKDSGECLTCSSSGSDAVIDKDGCEALGELSEKILIDIQSRDDIRTKQRGLEELLKMLRDPVMLESVEDRLSFLLQLLFSSLQQPFLQSISEQNLSHIFMNIKEETLTTRLHQIALHLSRIGSPLGVRLALLILKRIPAQSFIDHLLSDSILRAKSSKVREGALQILMSICRIFPSTEMDIPKCVDSVVQVLKDRKRKVRQAALETLAALTQLSSTSIVLDVITKIIQDYPDREQILMVVRTRLSRKQLPAVDINGNVRYSTPSGESEIEWLSRGSNGTPHTDRCQSRTVENHRTMDATYVKVEQLLENPSEEKINYWRGQNRNAEQFKQEASTTLSEDIDSDWSHESRDESSAKANSTAQIWAIDPTVFTAAEKITTINGTLRPVYVIQSTESQSTNVSNDSHNIKTHKQTNTDNHHEGQREHRGRSFSPPKRPRDVYEDQERFVQMSDTRQSNFYRNDKFRKSFSSDQLVPERYAGQTKSLSSGSSSTTSGSSFRSGVWSKDVRSGIPVPISSDSRFRFRTKYNDSIKGPMSTTQFYSSKLQTPEATPEKYSSPPRPIMAREPFSSGSESSGYFTPPAEPQLPDSNNFDHSPNEKVNAGQRSAHSENSITSNRFIRSGTPSSIRQHPENFTVIDSNYCESLKSKSAASSKSAFAESRFESVDYPDSREEAESPIREPSENKSTFEDDAEEEEEIINESYVRSEENIVRSESAIGSLEDLDLIANQAFGDRKNLSKSETDIKHNLDSQRKTVSSAPSLNETNFKNFEKFDDTPLSSTKTSLPGSIVDFQEIEVVQEVIEKSPTKTVCKKTITRQMSRKRSCRMPRSERSTAQENERPFPKPKEALNEMLSQLDSSEWEVTMKGLQNLMRIIKNHPNVIEQNMHAVCVGLGKHVRNLRSQVARAACLNCSELFKTFKKTLEADVEELATPLLHRTADTNKFLRSDANEALDEMCTYLSSPKVVSVITAKGANHQNAIVRCAAIRLLCSLCHRLGPEKVFQLPKDTRDKILVTGANMLMEGSLETRKHAKMMLGYLSSHCQFQRAMVEAVPSQVMRHISKTLKALT